MSQLLTPQIIRNLQDVFPGQIYTRVPLSQYSRWRVGGVAKCIIAPDSEQTLVRCMHFCKQNNLNYVVLGATSNLLFSDEGLAVLGISLMRLDRVRLDSTKVIAQAGRWAPSFARLLASKGLGGLEHIVGIPGSLAGLVYMNGGSQRKGIGSHIQVVKTIDVNGNALRYSHEECEFSYRHSVFQLRSEIILEVELHLKASSVSQVRKDMLAILKSRRKKFPLKQPNCGSVFVSNPSMYDEYGSPGAVIEYCKLKGARKGGAQVSPAHANFIVNVENASSKDILSLIKLVQQVVHDVTGYKMVSEVRYMDFSGNTCPAADAAF